MRGLLDEANYSLGFFIITLPDFRQLYTHIYDYIHKNSVYKNVFYYVNRFSHKDLGCLCYDILRKMSEKSHDTCI